MDRENVEVEKIAEMEENIGSVARESKGAETEEVANGKMIDHLDKAYNAP